MKGENKRLIIILIIVALVISGVNGFFTLKEQIGSQWICTSYECAKFRSGEEWAKDNCFLVEDQEVCNINVDGVNQLVPMANLNLSAVQQCVEVKCSQQVKVKQIR